MKEIQGAARLDDLAVRLCGGQENKEVGEQLYEGGEALLRTSRDMQVRTRPPACRRPRLADRGQQRVKGGGGGGR